MSPLPRGEHALHPLLVALVTLILAGLFCVDEAADRTRHLAVVAVLSSVGLQGLALGASGTTPGLVAAGAAALAITVLIAAILRQVFAAGPITFRRIEGAIAAYLLIGLVFACLYDLLHGMVPAAFLHHGEPARAGEQVGSYLFFSFVTLTTTGYGDIVPVHPVARSLAILEALTGQLHLAVLLARLVSLQIASRP